MVVLGVVTALVWIGLVRLGVAFLHTSLDWAYVAEQSRRGAPWYYRLAGVWGGMEGSLLLLAGIVGAVTSVAARGVGVGVRWAAAITVASLVAIDLVLASPFDRLAVPAVIGFGLNPILEHPAMAIHPPLLYLGLASSGAAAMHAAGSGRSSRRALLACVGILAAAMTLGGAWSYTEQGWGGYWAWDPVENTSLLVWLAALVALHVPLAARPACRLAAGLAPWVLALFGSALVRAGRTPSVHGFAEQLDVGLALLVVALVTLVGGVALVVHAPGPAQAAAAPTRVGVDASGDPRAVMVTLTTAAVVVVLVGTFAPVLTDVGSGRASVIGGEFFSRTVGPLAGAAVPFIAWRLRRVAGWSTLGHAGALVLLVGIGASAFDDVSTAPLAAGATLTAAGFDVRNDGVEVGDGPRQNTSIVTAVIDVAGHEMRPAIVVYPDRGGRLAEVAVRTGPWTDVHVVLETANDAGGIVVTVQRRHGMWLVWLGVLAISVSALLPAWAGSRRR